MLDLPQVYVEIQTGNAIGLWQSRIAPTSAGLYKCPASMCIGPGVSSMSLVKANLLGDRQGCRDTDLTREQVEEV